MVIYDPVAEQVMSTATHHMNQGENQGEVVIERGRFQGRAGHGAYLARATSQYLG